MHYSIARQFSYFPGPRLIEDGEYSGEAFREVLIDLMKKCLATGERLTIDLDGTDGYGYSFLEEAFGGLGRLKLFTKEQLSIIDIKSEEEGHWKPRIRQYLDSSATQQFSQAA